MSPRQVRISFCLAAIFLLPAAGGFHTAAAETEAPVRTEADRLRITPRYAIGYTPETLLMGTGGINGTYRTVCDIRVPYSSFDALAGISTNLSFFAGISGTWYAPCPDTRLSGFHIRYEGRFVHLPGRFYGTGYGQAVTGEYLEMKETSCHVKAKPLFRLSSHLLLGPVAGFDYIKTGFPDLNALSGEYASFSAGFHLEYDSRNSRTAPERGMLLSIENTASPSFGHGTGIKASITADAFCRLWKGAVLAFDIHGDLNSRDSWWMTWEKAGDGSRMRGYYPGRYRDRNFLCAQVELRQNFTEVHGAAVWAGAGNVFPSFGELRMSETLPTYGAGYRLNLFGTLFRIDLGFGLSGQWGVTAGMGHAF